MSATAPAADDKSNGKKEKPRRGALNDTGAHVLKGAIVTVLGPDAAVTTAVEFDKLSRGTLSVKYAPETALSQATIQEIQNAANDCIKANRRCTVTTLARAKAEQLPRVNHTHIYDEVPVPDTVTELRVFAIDGWNHNACIGAHVNEISELKALHIFKSRRKPKQGVYEFEFCVGDEAVEKMATAIDKTAFDSVTGATKDKTPQVKVGDHSDTSASSSSSSSASSSNSSASSSHHSSASSSSSSKSSSKQTQPKWKAAQKSQSEVASEQITSDLFSALASLPASTTIAQLLSDKQLLTNVLTPKLQHELTMQINAAYTKGFSSGLTAPQSQTPISRCL